MDATIVSADVTELAKARQERAIKTLRANLDPLKGEALAMQAVSIAFVASPPLWSAEERCEVIEYFTTACNRFMTQCHLRVQQLEASEETTQAQRNAIRELIAIQEANVHRVCRDE